MRIYAYDFSGVNRRKGNFCFMYAHTHLKIVCVCLRMYIVLFFVTLRANIKALPIYIKLVGTYSFV
jgi:hypothetical protein